jgi:hypothetical protein
MTRDDIIRLAREAKAWQLPNLIDHDGLERFAALVAAAEREACAKVCEKAVEYNPDDADVAYAFADAIRARGESK